MDKNDAIEFAKKIESELPIDERHVLVATVAMEAFVKMGIPDVDIALIGQFIHRVSEFRAVRISKPNDI